MRNFPTLFTYLIPFYDVVFCDDVHPAAFECLKHKTLHINSFMVVKLPISELVNESLKAMSIYSRMKLK